MQNKKLTTKKKSFNSIIEVIVSRCTVYRMEYRLVLFKFVKLPYDAAFICDLKRCSERHSLLFRIPTTSWIAHRYRLHTQYVHGTYLRAICESQNCIQQACAHIHGAQKNKIKHRRTSSYMKGMKLQTNLFACTQ